MDEGNKKNKLNDTIVAIIVVLVFGIFTGVCFLFGIRGLFYSQVHPMEDIFKGAVEGDMYDGQITYLFPSYKNVNQLIGNKSVGTEYYFMMVSKDGRRAMLVRAPKKWSAYVGRSLSDGDVLQYDGMVKNLHYKTRKKLSGLFANAKREGMQVNEYIYLDIYAKRICILQLTCGCCSILSGIFLYVLVKRARKAGPYVQAVMNGTEDHLLKPIAIITIVLILITAVLVFYICKMT